MQVLPGTWRLSDEEERWGHSGQREASTGEASVTGKASFQELRSGASLPVQWFRLPASKAGGEGLISGLGTKIPHIMWLSQRKKQNKTDAPPHLCMATTGEKADSQWRGGDPGSLAQGQGISGPCQPLVRGRQVPSLPRAPLPGKLAGGLKHLFISLGLVFSTKP